MTDALPTPRMRRRRYVAAAPSWAPAVDRKLARRCLYAGAFFYASFWLHTWVTSERFGPSFSEEARLAPEVRVPARPGVLEGMLAAVVTPVTSASGRQP